MFFFNDDKSKVDAESYIAQAINNLSETLRELINQKSNIGHTHSATDIVSGVLDIARIPGLAASKITEGVLDVARIPGLAASKITSGSLAIARGGTGATTADAARTNLGATKKRNITANYSGTTTDTPDFLLKTFTGSFGISGTSFPQTHDVNVSMSGYTAIAIAGLSCHMSGQPALQIGAVVKNATTATIRLEHASAGSGQYSYTMQVLYVRTAIINQ